MQQQHRQGQEDERRSVVRHEVTSRSAFCKPFQYPESEVHYVFSAAHAVATTNKPQVLRLRCAPLRMTPFILRTYGSPLSGAPMCSGCRPMPTNRPASCRMPRILVRTRSVSGEVTGPGLCRTRLSTRCATSWM